MNRKIFLRMLLDILIAISILNGWWLVALPLGIFGAGYFPCFIEAIVAGIAYDSLFRSIGEMGWAAYAGTLISIAVFVMLAGMKRLVR